MQDFYVLDVERAIDQLGSNHHTGLDPDEVQRRQAEYGKNALPTDSGTNWFELIIGQFTDLMVIILIVAAVISLFLGDVKDVIVIMAIVILNAALGIFQEYRAERALAALNAMQVPLVRVRRGGAVIQISAEDLVPGDIIILQEGDRVPADGRLIEVANLQIDEAALTGESLPVEKSTATLRDNGGVALGDRSNMAFMGTAVTYGRGEMIVTRIGLKTELGLIAAMLLQVEQGITPLQRRLNRLGQVLAIGAGIIVAIVFVAGVLRGIGVQAMFLTAISLAVAAVPEGLPALITISLSLGAARMVRRNALIRRLPAVETLGSVNTICSDKTGTLTRNEMTVTHIALPGHPDVSVTGIGYAPSGEFRQKDGDQIIAAHDHDALGRLLRAMTLCTNAYIQEPDADSGYSIMGDTTEGALLVAARKAGWTREALEVDFPRCNELPFSSMRKAMTTVHEVAGEDTRRLFSDAAYIAITKGAPDQLVDWAAAEHLPDGPLPLDDGRRADWHAQIDTMARQGLRVLGIAYRPLPNCPATLTPEIERDLVLIGLVGILDPARPEAREAVKRAHSAGIRVVMITGDHALTAETIARDLNILRDGERALTGAHLGTMDEAALAAALKTATTFARVSPEHKLRIVQALQHQNQIVAMTGDGVNDAPALKQADIGVAMGITGTDVSKGAAAMVLTDDNFASIVNAVEEGRVIYDNIRKFIKYLLSSNVGEILVMFLALLAGLPIPLYAIQILWINLVTDGLPAIALGFEPAERDVMQRKPHPRDESVLAGGTGPYIVWVGVLIALLTLGGYVWGYTSQGMDPFRPGLGLEGFTAQQLNAVVPAAYIPADWDALSPEARLERYLQNDNAEPLEESAEDLLTEAETVPRTIAFTVLAMAQMFGVMAIHAGDRVSFFRVGFSTNYLLLGAVLLTTLLQVGVIYMPFMQATFETASLTLEQFTMSMGLAAVVLFAVELMKLFNRRADLSAAVPAVA